MSWDQVKLSDISKAIQTGPFGSQLHQSDYSETGTPVVMPKDIIHGRISEESIARVSKDYVERLCKYEINDGDIIYARRGDVGRCAITTFKEEGWLCGTGCLRVTIDRTKAEPMFVFYQLQKADTIGWVVNHAVGSTMLNLNTSILSDVPIQMPELKIQSKIVNILSAYDDLIENNKKQISLLEEAARRLYKEWFVDMRFPGHETTKIIDGVPEGWECTNVGNLLEKIPRKKHVPVSEYLSKGNIPVIDQSREFIAGYTNDEDAKIELNGPVIVFGDHTRILKLIPFPFANGADGTQLILSKTKSMPQHLFYYSLLNIDLSNYHYARHFKYLKSEKIMIPSRWIAEMFEKHALVMHAMIQKLRMINLRLTEARDRLLSKLMSGEIEVKA